MTVLEGADFVTGPSGAQMAALGKKFAMRYIAHVGGLTKAELTDKVAHGISVGVVAEWGARDALSGYAQGQTIARAAQAAAVDLGIATIPIYFAVDFDANVGQRTWDANVSASIKAYLDGIASIIGRGRTGVYGGYYVVEWALSHGYATWGWQTYAWSAGMVSTRAHVYQYSNGVYLYGFNTDLDRSLKVDFGQYPRPAIVPPAPVGKFLRHEVIVTAGVRNCVFNVARFTHTLSGAMCTTWGAGSRAPVIHGIPGFWRVTAGFGATDHYYVYGHSGPFAVRAVYQRADGSVYYVNVNPAS